jgi:hypothetical protein
VSEKTTTTPWWAPIDVLGVGIPMFGIVARYYHSWRLGLLVSKAAKDGVHLKFKEDGTYDITAAPDVPDQLYEEWVERLLYRFNYISRAYYGTWVKWVRSKPNGG